MVALCAAHKFASRMPAYVVQWMVCLSASSEHAEVVWDHIVNLAGAGF